jgi:Fe-S-cluster containining protein
MKTDNRTHIQKATDVMYTSARMAKQVVDHLIEDIKQKGQPNDNLQRMHDEQLHVLENYINLLHEKTDTHPSCKNNCSGCCKYPIWATEVEYKYIMNWVATHLTNETTVLINDNLKKWNEEIGQLALSYKPGDKQKSNEYTRKNVKCPFLIDNSCSIYEARPVVCRTYFSYGNPKNCEREMYPKGTLNLDCASGNVYRVAMCNKIRVAVNGDKKREEELFKQAVGVKLLPLWFLGDN